MMAGQWKEVVRLSFKGQRFRDHALDLGALSELTQFQKMVAETSKELWRKANPDRERIPARFEERTRLCLREIKEGSAVVPLEVYVEPSVAPTFWEDDSKELDEAIALAYEVFESLERDAALPERFPKALIAEYAKWGQSLGEDEEVEIVPPGRQPTRLRPSHSKTLTTFAETPYQDHVDIQGEVFEADVRQKRFQIWAGDQSAVVAFSPEQEEAVTTALKEHKTLRMTVRGWGEFSPLGKLLRITGVEELAIQEVGAVSFDPSARPIEEVLEALAKDVPNEEWKRMPDDLTDNLDHYLYGTPKR